MLAWNVVWVNNESPFFSEQRAFYKIRKNAFKRGRKNGMKTLYRVTPVARLDMVPSGNGLVLMSLCRSSWLNSWGFSNELLMTFHSNVMAFNDSSNATPKEWQGRLLATIQSKWRRLIDVYSLHGHGHLALRGGLSFIWLNSDSDYCSLRSQVPLCTSWSDAMIQCHGRISACKLSLWKKRDRRLFNSLAVDW